MKIRGKTSWGFRRFETGRKTKAIADKSDDELSMQKETYNRLLNEKLNEIQEISEKKYLLF